MPDYVEKTITAQNQFTEKFTPDVGMREPPVFMNISIEGTFVATVTLQRSFDNGGTWKDTDTFASPDELCSPISEQAVVYRLGVKTGDFTSGSIEARLSY